MEVPIVPQRIETHQLCVCYSAGTTMDTYNRHCLIKQLKVVRVWQIVRVASLIAVGEVICGDQSSSSTESERIQIDIPCYLWVELWFCPDTFQCKSSTNSCQR